MNPFLRGSITLHATQCSLYFDKHQINKIHSLNKWFRGHTEICGLFCEFVASPGKENLVAIMSQGLRGLETKLSVVSFL